MPMAKAIISAFRRDENTTGARGWVVNLAIFRVVFLGLVALPWALRCFGWAANILPHLPDSVWAPISFFRLIPLDVLHNVGLVRALGLVNILLIVMALIGFMTRLSTGLAALLSIYLFGLMENLGKVDHFHHVVWFMAMLAVADSGRLLSVDALCLAIKKADAGTMEQEYKRSDALWVLRYIWVLLGLVYLGPGIAKLMSAMTVGWAGAANLQNIFLRKWLELSWYDPGFVLPLRVDRMPHLILEVLGCGAIVFESCFVAAVLFRFFRPALAFAGIAFHVGNGIFLGIWFTTLLPVYACLVDWAAMARNLNRRLKIPAFVVYDGSCRLCRRTIAILKSLDLFDALTAVPGSSGDPRRTRFLSLTDEMLARDLYFIEGDKITVGYDAYVQMARRTMVLWPLGFIMGLKPVAAAGRKLYRRVADSRRCALPTIGSKRDAPRQMRAAWIHLVGILFAAGQFCVTGSDFIAPHCQRFLSSKQWFSPVAQFVNGVATCRWPFDLYPTFAGKTASQVDTVEYRWVGLDGAERVASPTAYWETFQNPGLTWYVMTEFGQDQAGGPNQTKSLDLARALWRAEKPDLRESAVGLRLYRVQYRLDGGPDSLARLVSQTPAYTFPVELLTTGDQGEAQFNSATRD